VTVITGYGTAEAISHTLTINQQPPGGGGDPFDVAPLSATSDSGADSVSISLSNLTGAWTAGSNKDWITLSSAGGDGTDGIGSLTASWPANAQGTRFATITITCGGVSRGIQIQQAGDATATFTLIPDNFVFGQSGSGYGGSIRVDNVVPSSAKWNCDSTHGWCGVSQSYDDYSGQSGVGYVSLNVNPNTFEVDRSCVVSVWSGTELRLATVIQACTDIQVHYNSKEINTGTGNWYTSGISLSKIYPAASIWSAESDVDWIKFRQDGDVDYARSTATFDGSNYYYNGGYGCYPNIGTDPRIGHITVRNGIISDVITVTQPGGGVNSSVTVGDPDGVIDASGYYQQCNITWSNRIPEGSWVNINIPAGCDWLQRSNSPTWSQDYTACTEHFSASSNSGPAREAEVSFSCNEYLVTKTIRQLGVSDPYASLYIWCNESYGYVPASGGTLGISINNVAPAEETASVVVTGADGIVLSKSSGIKNESVTATIPANASSSPRTISVTVSVGAYSATQTIEQYGSE
jgi:hypothetical protein